MRPLKISSAKMVESARARIEEVESADLISMLDDPDVVVVDIRDVRERQRSGYIPGSFHAPRGMIEFWIDPDSPYFKEIFGLPITYLVRHRPKCTVTPIVTWKLTSQLEIHIVL